MAKRRNNNNSNNNNSDNNNTKYNGVQFGFSDKIPTDSKGGGFWINGWNYSKGRGKITLSGVENKRSKRYKGETLGKRHIMLFVEVFYQRTGVTVVEYIDFCLDSGTATMSKMGMFIDAENGSWTNLVNPKNYKK